MVQVIKNLMRNATSCYQITKLTNLYKPYRTHPLTALLFYLFLYGSYTYISFKVLVGYFSACVTRLYHFRSLVLRRIDGDSSEGCGGCSAARRHIEAAMRHQGEKIDRLEAQVDLLVKLMSK